MFVLYFLAVFCVVMLRAFYRYKKARNEKAQNEHRVTIYVSAALCFALLFFGLFAVYGHGLQSHHSGSVSGVAAQVIPEARSSAEPAETPEPDITYVLNTNTRKFHYPDCRSVDQIKLKNREDTTAERDAVIARGFVPCKNCNP